MNFTIPHAFFDFTIIPSGHLAKRQIPWNTYPDGIKMISQNHFINSNGGGISVVLDTSVVGTFGTYHSF
jgi:hypothetical protein